MMTGDDARKQEIKNKRTYGKKRTPKDKKVYNKKQ